MKASGASGRAHQAAADHQLLCCTAQQPLPLPLPPPYLLHRYRLRRPRFPALLAPVWWLYESFPSAHASRLSDLVLNHQVANIVLLEQIYRAFTILRGEPYHH